MSLRQPSSAAQTSDQHHDDERQPDPRPGRAAGARAARARGGRPRSRCPSGRCRSRRVIAGWRAVVRSRRQRRRVLDRDGNVGERDRGRLGWRAGGLGAVRPARRRPIGSSSRCVSAVRRRLAAVRLVGSAAVGLGAKRGAERVHASRRRRAPARIAVAAGDGSGVRRPAPPPAAPRTRRSGSGRNAPNARSPRSRGRRPGRTSCSSGRQSASA